MKSRLGRKALVILSLAAILPLAVLALVSHRSADGQMDEAARTRLQVTAEGVGRSLLDRLSLAEAELRIVAEAYERSGRVRGVPSTIGRLEAVWLERVGEAPQEPPVAIPQPVVARRGSMSREDAALQFAETAGRAFAVVTVPVPGSGGSLVRAIVDPEYLWGDAIPGSRPESPEVVLSLGGTTLSAGASELATALAEGAIPAERDDSSVFEIPLSGRTFLVHSRTLPLGAHFGQGEVRLVAAEPVRGTSLGIRGLKSEALLAATGTIVLILLASSIWIPRRLRPLEKLEVAIGKLAQREFDHRIVIKGKGELAGLGECFNDMSDRLADHFEHLTATVELDRAILSGVDVPTIADNALRIVEQTYELQGSALLLLPHEGASGRVHWRAAGDLSTREERIRIYEPEQEWLRSLDKGAAPCEPRSARWLAPSLTQDRSLAAVPVHVEDELGAVLVVGRDEPFNADHLALLSAVGNQLGVALSKVALFTDLQEMKTGALTAFARTVDAKSKWTSGHSERVTAVAVRIGEKLGFGPERLELLHRGGLLHDIGKIGVSADILDKPGRLTDEEMAAIRQHPEIGARILEPISSYRDIIPMVLQHHEQWNGGGYPAGLAGEEIAMEARVMAVADVYDALTSTRPYRQGMTIDDAVAIIFRDSGSHFDPVVVRAFRRVVPELREAGLEAA